MSYRQTRNVTEVYTTVRELAAEARDPRNDGWTASGCKHELYQLKCFIEDLYRDLPTFTIESEWEQDRLIQIMKRK
jgi:hypothetical protein